MLMQQSKVAKLYFVPSWQPCFDPLAHPSSSSSSFRAATHTHVARLPSNAYGLKIHGGAYANRTLEAVARWIVGGGDADRG